MRGALCLLVVLGGVVGCGSEEVEDGPGWSVADERAVRLRIGANPRDPNAPDRFTGLDATRGVAGGSCTFTERDSYGTSTTTYTHGASGALAATRSVYVDSEGVEQGQECDVTSDSAGLLLSRSCREQGGGPLFHVTYERDSAGRMLVSRTDFMDGSEEDTVERFGYDELGRIKSDFDSQGAVSLYTYSEDGLTQATSQDANGDGVPQAEELSSEQRYFEDGRPDTFKQYSEIYGGSLDAPVVLTRSYAGGLYEGYTSSGGISGEAPTPGLAISYGASGRPDKLTSYTMPTLEQRCEVALTWSADGFVARGALVGPTADASDYTFEQRTQGSSCASYYGGDLFISPLRQACQSLGLEYLQARSAE